MKMCGWEFQAISKVLPDLNYDVNLHWTQKDAESQEGLEMGAYPAKQCGGAVTNQLKNARSLLMFDVAIFLKRKSI